MTAHLHHALQWIESLGPWGPLAFIGLYIVATVAFIPGSLLTLGAGALFGVLKGTVCVSIASTLGATVACSVARYAARGWVARKMSGHPQFAAIDEAVKRGGWRVILLLRLSPMFPFNVFNYAAGLTDVPLGQYIWASWIGMLPGTLLYVYIGSLAGGVATVGGAHQRTSLEWALYSLGLLATAAVTIYITRLSRKALDRRLHPHG